MPGKLSRLALALVLIALSPQGAGSAVAAPCAMLAATCTMWDTLGWGGETQALIYHPGLEKVIGVNALGTAPAGATPAFFRERGLSYPPEYGPLAAVLPGTPGSLLTLLAEYGTLTLGDVLAPAREMAHGYPIEAQHVRSIERFKAQISAWPSSRKEGAPYLAFAVQGGDTQDQNLLQFFLDVVELGMTVQEATEAANLTSTRCTAPSATTRARPGASPSRSRCPPGCATSCSGWATRSTPNG